MTPAALFSNPFSKQKTGRSTHPTQIRNKFYNNLREFTAWEPWGEPTGHSKHNHDYIPTKDPFVKRIDYPAKLQHLIDFGWKTVSARGARGGHGLLIGGQRSAGPIDLNDKGAPSPLRKALGHAVPCDWDHLKKIEMVNAFAYRGDTRPPEQIFAAGGFFPAATRTDDDYKATTAEQFYKYMNRKHGLTLDQQGKADFIQQVIGFLRNEGQDGKLFSEYHFWTTLLDHEQMHLKTMTDVPFQKSYVSTTRDIAVAKEGSTGALASDNGVKQTGGGWVYVIRVKSGFLLKKGVGGIRQTEGEIAHFGPLLWKNVYGFISRDRKNQTIYLRNGFDQEDYKAFRLVLGALSNIETTYS